MIVQIPSWRTVFTSESSPKGVYKNVYLGAFAFSPQRLISVQCKYQSAGYNFDYQPLRRQFCQERFRNKRGAAMSQNQSHTPPILEVQNLSVAFDTYEGRVHAVNQISFHLMNSESLAIVGESGCGKSASMFAVMRL